MSVKIVTDKNMEEVLEKNQIIFLDFWASWCEPCKVFAPIYDRVSAAHPDLFFGKVNTETEHLLGSDFQIKSIPTLVILKEGTIIFSESGVIPEYVLNNIVAEARKIDVSTLIKEDPEI
ncbi:MAG: thioredoxin family protein [Bacteriovorax sp.]|nr:thioredoxin family protein [Bacteriovorax sp.]